MLAIILLKNIVINKKFINVDCRQYFADHDLKKLRTRQKEPLVFVLSAL